MDKEIDDSFYSRQRYVLGDTAMHRLAQSDVYLAGVGSVGIEIAKNLVLAGVQSLTIQDGKTASLSDVGTQFFIREDDVSHNRNRAQISCYKLSALNPYVKVKAITSNLNMDSDLEFLTAFSCVILTEAPIELQLKVNEFCREFHSPIRFITADVYGVCCWAFCDFGRNFEVIDPNGEEPKEIIISYISKTNPGVVTTSENRHHGLETGDQVVFSDVQGMSRMNGRCLTITVLTPFTFSICDTTSDEFLDYQGGGVFRQVKVPQYVDFEALSVQLYKPIAITPDYGKTDTVPALHLAMLSFYLFWQQQSRLPHVWDSTDANTIQQLAQQINAEKFKNQLPVNQTLLWNLSMSARGCLLPLASLVGGIVAQEVLKATTGKFTPLKQWFNFECCELMENFENGSVADSLPKPDRYQSLGICIGEKALTKLSDMNLFLVGCGAIGCEMIKNCALIGIGTNYGKITVTDNDIIEKTNLNRQFLFRPHHIRQSKSVIAAQEALVINKGLNVVAQQQKVCPQTEKIYAEDFFSKQDIVVTALDNVEGRRYIDSLCVKYCRPMFDSGTVGTKGHTQVIIPHKTESYASQFDPSDEDIPYCTLKSFPTAIEHTIQWARDKFENLFHFKPTAYNKFWLVNSNVEATVNNLLNGIQLDSCSLITKLLKRRPQTMLDCVIYARLLFEKYFNHRAQQLLHTFPNDSKLEDGSLFWQFPKRSPSAIKFDSSDNLHCDFTKSTAHLLAQIYGIQGSLPENIVAVMSSIQAPEFVPKNKRIETDETITKAQSVFSASEEEPKDCAFQVMACVNAGRRVPADIWMHPLEFEKDNDSNKHIDFIVSASNLRASMYGIETADRFKIKKIAGKIIPAIATTTSVVASLVTLELMKYVSGVSQQHHRNCFLNLALPMMVLSEPGKLVNENIGDGISFSIWDKWEVQGNASFTLQQLIDELTAKTNLKITMVVEGTRMVYVPIMPGHAKRCSQTMLSLLKLENASRFRDLSVAFELKNGEEIVGPPIRYYMG